MIRPLATLLSALAAFVMAQLTFAATPASSGIVALDTPVLLANESGSATTILHLHNQGPAARLALSLSDFEHSRAMPDNSAPNPSEAPKTYALGTTALLTGFDTESQKALQSGTLEAGAILAVKISVDHLWEAGASRARIYNDGLPVMGPDASQATVKAVRIPTQYNIQLEQKGEIPEIQFNGGKGQLQIKNLDPMNYDFNWELRTGNQVTHGWVELPASSVTTLDVSSGAPHVPWVNGLLKEVREDANFVLKPAFVDVHQPAPSKAFPVKLRISWGSSLQQIVNVCFLMLLLAIGGTLSIWVNWGMPNTSRALAVRKKLWEAQTKLNGTGDLVAAKWRVILAAQLEWVLREMKSTLWIFPGFSTTLDALEQKILLLQNWIDIAYDVAVVREESQQLQHKQRLAPTLLRFLAEHCDHALEPLETGHTSAAELTSMAAELATAQSLLRGGTGANQPLEQDIKAREALLLTKLPGLKESFTVEFGNLIADFERSVTEPLTPAVYADRDTLAVKLLMLSEFRDCLRRAAPAQPLTRTTTVGGADAAALPASYSGVVAERLEQHRPRFFDCLRTDSYETLCMARMYLEEMHQDIYPEAMLAELTPEPRLTISTEPRTIEPGAPVRASLLFRRDILNGSAARQEWTCVWDFGDQSQKRTGWSVFHTFPEHGTFTVQVNLHGPDARPIDHKPITATLKVDAPRSNPVQTPSTSVPQKFFRVLRLPKPHAETMLEASRLALVLAATVFGLITTAQDKIRDLTFLEAATAVMVLGFGADTLKNLVTRRS